ncbi:endothelin-converting enzyme 1 [Teleopsis dalmanni]|uniref:endothelin-converting enzyme 1 n=1 Tax=Teleopsis dalmanni TaxID=139649 RepID=UPI0018CE15FB|nr:endothelin-converting enzyme 1 [Teleopsis dalmanni]
MWALWLIYLSGLGVLLLISAKSITHISDSDEWQNVNQTCLTRACDKTVNIQHLEKLRSYMRPEVDPCEDYHQYACGNWRKIHPNGTTMIRRADDLLTEKYVKLFEDATNHTLWQERDIVFEKLVKYYHVCKSSEQVEPLKLRGYYDILHANSMWRLQGYNWQAALAEFGRYGYKKEFMQTQVKQANATSHRMQVVSDSVEKKLNLTSEIFDILADYTKLDFDTLKNEFQKLETDFDNLVNKTRAGHTEEFNDNLPLVGYTLTELKEECPEIDWQLFLDIQMGRPILGTELIWIYDMELLKNYAKYLHQADNSLMFLYTVAGYLSYLRRQSHGILSLGANSNNCIRHMRKNIYIPMTYVYEHAYYGHKRAESDPVINFIFNQLKLEFKRTLEINKMQFSAEVLTYLQDKLTTLHLNLGNLPVNVTKQFYVDYIHNLNVSESFYRNHLQALEHFYIHQRHLADMKETEHINPWYTFNYQEPEFPDSLDATPHYFCLSNMIIIPHAYLQRPFYHQQFWPGLLYGDLAATLGHELLHAFDNEFLEYDHMGNLSDMEQVIVENSNFKKNLDCIEQDTEFVSERIADISGTRLALNTFLRNPTFLQHNGKIFFLQLAQFFCGSMDSTTFHLEDPYHDVDSLRLNYMLANTPEYARTFNCPIGSPMNPAVKCEL